MSLSNTSSYYSFLPKDSSRDSYKSVGKADYAYLDFGDILTSSYPLKTTIDCYRYSATSEYVSTRKRIYALKNTLNFYSSYSPHYNYSSSYGDKSKQEIILLSIPSIFYGSSIDKGTVELSFYISGTLIAKLQDVNKNGELIQTIGTLGSGNVAGVVLYNEGFVLLTGSWNLDNIHTEEYIYNPDNSVSTDNPKWLYWGAGFSAPINYTVSSSYDIKFEGINYINTLTMFAHAEKGEYNHSNNPTYVKHSQPIFVEPNISTNTYEEYSKYEIKNTVKYPYENYTGSLEKQTYISKIGIFDDNKNLIAIAKFAKPIRKSENRDFTFKLKLDI